MGVRMNNNLGSIVIDSNVVATYAGSVAVECFGIVGMASVSMKDGLVRLLGREHLGRGINVATGSRWIFMSSSLTGSAFPR